MNPIFDLRSMDRADRRDVLVDGTLVVDGVRHDVEICDISASGFKAQLEVPLPQGTLVMLATPSLEKVFAKVVRRQGALHGFQFLNYLSLQSLAAVRPIDTVIPVDFGALSNASESEGEPEAFPLRPWSMRRKIALVVGMSGLLWLLIGLLIYAGLRLL